MTNIARYNEPVVSNVTTIIKAKGLKQSYVAAMMGLTPNELNAILNGRRLLKISETPKLADALKVEINELYSKINA